MNTDTPKTIYLKDYQPYPYEVTSLYLDFDLQEGGTTVKAKATYRRKGMKQDIYLYGEDLELLSLKINGWDVKDYTVDEKGLTIPAPSEDEFTLEIKTKIYPEKNTRLEGLYMSGGNYCTQCEAEGFRRITYFPDRPDVLTVFTVRIEADREKFPVLLSNGNRIDGDIVGKERHFTIWEDPFPKPCYLFALVAGALNHIHDTFTTKSGREVDLYIYVRPGDEDQCDHAMRSLKNSMKWDEDVYGLEYELDIFNIVAVSDFNMGAMENTSLNIFNTALVLAAQATATDADFGRVESVIAHEYFHNWSGNRVTCRDWFQLSLKEGLTVFRDQEFSADLNSRPVQRIDDVTHLRRFQFAEDASPLAHPIRPEEYIEINNFYTMTVYEKGAEVIRMLRTIVGAENYRKGTDLYFSRHDGQAVTCEDWIKCHEEASGIDLSQFRLWYSQAGTPRVSFSGTYDAATKTYTVSLSQEIPDTPGQTGKKPMHIPFALGLFSSDGKDITQSVILTDRKGVEESDNGSDPSTSLGMTGGALGMTGGLGMTESLILHLTEQTQSFVIENVESAPVPSPLRGFSAPVILTTDLSHADYIFLTQHETTDGFNRWEAGQILQRKMLGHITDAVEAGEKPEICENFLQGYGEIYTDALKDGISDEDRALLARAMALPDVATIIRDRELADPEAIYKARQAVLAALKRTHKPTLEKIYKANANEGEFSVEFPAMARRSLRNAALFGLTATHGTGCAKLAKEHYFAADNMTDRVAALAAIAPNKNAERDEVFADFYERFKAYPLVVDKWFSLQASAVRDDLIERVKTLREHPDFNIKNPNRVRSLYSAFAMNNPVKFHQLDGAGYTLLADAIIELNTINPQIAARLLTPMREWRKYTSDRQEKMKAELERILATPDLAPDVFEIASKSVKG